MKITKQWLKSKDACEKSYKWFLDQKTEDAKTLFDLALKKERLPDINWVLTKKMNKKQYVIYTIFAAEIVLPNFEMVLPHNNRPRLAIKAAKKYLKTPNKNTKAAAEAKKETYIKILNYGFDLLIKK